MQTTYIRAATTTKSDKKRPQQKEWIILLHPYYLWIIIENIIISSLFDGNSATFRLYHSIETTIISNE